MAYFISTLRRRTLSVTLFFLAGAVWFFWIIYIIFAFYLPGIPVTWPLFAGFISGILIFLVPALILAFPWSEPLAPRRLYVSIWLVIVGVYWIFAPLYSYLSVNTNRELVLWYMIPYAWEVPVVGGLFYLIVFLAFRNLRRRQAAFLKNPAGAKVVDLQQAFVQFPVFVGLLIVFFAFIGYGPVGSAQYRFLGEAPWVEVVKNTVSGTTIGIISGVIYFFLLNYILAPWRASLPSMREKLPFPLKRKLAAIGSVMTLLAFLIFVPVAYKRAQVILEQGMLEHMASDSARTLGSKGYAFTVNRAGAIIGNHPRGFTDIKQEKFEPEMETILKGSKSVALVSRRLENRYIVSFPREGVNKISVAYESDFLGRLQPLLAVSVLIILVFGAIFALLIILFARGISEPVERLTYAVREMTRRRRSVPVVVRTGDEVEVLADEFSEMARQIRDYEENLERKITERTAELHEVNVELREKSLVLERVLDDVKRVDEELARLNRAKSEFISMASHQLRTPLTAIKWYAKILSNSGIKRLNPKQLRAYHQIVGANEHMIDLVNSLLNVSRIEMGTLAVEPNLVEVGKVIEQASRDIVPLALEQGVKLAAGPFSKITAVLDQKLLTVVVNNLLSNAVRYTPKGGKVAVTLRGKGGHVIIRVTDTGYGIPRAQQKQVFTKFFRGSNVVEHEPQGTGLGLYLTKAVVEVMKGKITFTSKESKGTTFEVSFPQQGLQSQKGSKGLLPMS